MKKVLAATILALLMLALGCHALTFGLWPGKEAAQTPAGVQQPSPTGDAWARLALVGVAFGLAICLAQWKFPPLVTPLAAVMSGLGIIIAVQALWQTILVGVLIVAILAALAFVIWVFVLKKTVAQAQAVLATVVDGVENAKNPMVKSEIKTIAEERGTAAPLNAVLDERGYLGQSAPQVTSPVLTKEVVTNA